MNRIVVWATGRLSQRFIEQMGKYYSIQCVVEGSVLNAAMASLKGIPVMSK